MTTESYRLDEETRKKLMGAMPMTDGATFEHIPKIFRDQDIPKQFQTVFTLRVFTTYERTQVKKIMNKPIESDKDLKEKETIWRDCVQDIENLYDLKTCEMITFDKTDSGKIPLDVWNNLPELIKQDIGRELAVAVGLMDPNKLMEMGLR